MSSVYIHINNLNNKKYVGFSKYDNPEQRWGFEGAGYKGQKIYNEGILPFGWNSFTHKVLIKDISLSLARSIEYALIDKLNLIQEGYNEDKGTIFEEDKEQAYYLAQNLIRLVNSDSNKSSIQKLSDIINIKYTATTVNYRLEYLYDLFKKDRINTQLDCQREYVWDEIRQQGLWDTLLYGHRIPEMHAIRRPDGTYDIIDGKQRLLTLMKILNNEIPLKRNNASEEIKVFMVDNNISKLFFKDIDKTLQNKILDKELAIAEYTNVDEDILIVLFQKLNAGKSLSEFQKCIANNILVRIRYTQFFENSFFTQLFSNRELSSNEDEICLVRLLSTLNCGKIDNIDGLEQRNLHKIIERMNIKTLIKTKETIQKMLSEFKELNIQPKDLIIINKTWYPLVFKFYCEELSDTNKKLFKTFLKHIKIPAQRGKESNKSETISRYNSIISDWKYFLDNYNVDKNEN